MSVYTIIAFRNPDSLREAIASKYGESFYEFTPSTWFVVDAGSTKTIADKIGLTDGKAGAQGVVVRSDAFSGWGPPAAWKWLYTREAVPNG